MAEIKSKRHLSVEEITRLVSDYHWALRCKEEFSRRVAFLDANEGIKLTEICFREPNGARNSIPLDFPLAPEEIVREFPVQLIRDGLQGILDEITKKEKEIKDTLEGN